MFLSSEALSPALPGQRSPCGTPARGLKAALRRQGHTLAGSRSVREQDRLSVCSARRREPGWPGSVCGQEVAQGRNLPECLTSSS